MENLKEQYQAIENDFDWPKSPRSTDTPTIFTVGQSKQFYQIAKSLRQKVQERSLNEKLIPNEYERRLHILSDFLSNLRYSFIPIDFDSDDLDSELVDKNENKQRLWYHRTARQIEGLDNQETKGINKDIILETATTYLTYQWLQLNAIDWIFLDSLIFLELAGYREGMERINWNYVVLAGGSIDTDYFLEGGTMEKNYWITVRRLLVFFALRYIIPPAVIAGLFYPNYEGPFFIIVGVYIAYIIIHIALWPFRYRKRKKIYFDLVDLRQKMTSVYYNCKPPVIIPISLESCLKKAQDTGAVFNTVVYAILNRILERDKNVFLPYSGIVE